MRHNVNIKTTIITVSFFVRVYSILYIMFSIRVSISSSLVFISILGFLKGPFSPDLIWHISPPVETVSALVFYFLVT